MSNRNPIEILKKTQIHTYPVNFYRPRKRKKYRNRFSMLIYFSRHLQTAFGSGGSVEQRLGQTLQYAAFHFGPNLLLSALHKSPRQICSCALEPETLPYSCAQHSVCFASGRGRSCLFAFTSSRALNPRAKQKQRQLIGGNRKEPRLIFQHMPTPLLSSCACGDH